MNSLKYSVIRFTKFPKSQLNRTICLNVQIGTRFRALQRKHDTFKCFCSTSDGVKNKQFVKEELKAYIETKKESLKSTEKKLKQKGSNLIKDFKDKELRLKEKGHVILQDIKSKEQKLKEKRDVILQDIKDTKDKVKEKMEIIIERENIYTIPNLLCITRIALSPYLGMLIVQADFNHALAVLGFAAVTDLLDGWIARTWQSQSSKMGSFLDPVADKILIATLFLTLTYANLIPIILTGIIVAKDVMLIAAGVVIRYRSLPPPKTLSRYFDATHATAQLAPTYIGKVNTVIQLLLVGSTLAAPVFGYINHPALECLWYITGASTIAAGMSYVLSKNTYKFLKK